MARVSWRNWAAGSEWRGVEEARADSGGGQERTTAEACALPPFFRKSGERDLSKEVAVSIGQDGFSGYLYPGCIISGKWPKGVYAGGEFGEES
jgi:hypothetical protein